MGAVDDEGGGMDHELEPRRIGVGDVDNLVLPVPSEPHIVPGDDFPIGDNPGLETFRVRDRVLGL